MVVNLNHLKAECLPGDLVHEIEVDISPLVDFETSIYVKDLNIPKGIEIRDNLEEVVATVAPPRVEEEVLAPPPAEGEAAKVAEVEVVEKKKKEEVVEEER